MRKKKTEHSQVTLMSAAVLVLGVCNVAVWRNVLVGEPKASVEQAPLEVPVQIPRLEIAPPPPTAAIALPVRITISSIDVDAPVIEVALAEDGSMDVPKDPHEAAWYELGPRPGEQGSAVIAGHVDTKRGAPGIFANLHRVQPGDTIDVQGDDGSIVSFEVRGSRNFDATADATEVFGATDGKTSLNIVTCTGKFDPHTKTYPARLVVFAEKIGE